MHRPIDGVGTRKADIAAIARGAAFPRVFNATVRSATQRRILNFVRCVIEEVDEPTLAKVCHYRPRHVAHHAGGADAYHPGARILRVVHFITV